jgi:hypothetical protein
MAKAVKYVGNIYVWESSTAYRREVEHYLNLIRTTKAGEVLVKHIGLKPYWMLISPYKPTKDDPVNAYAIGRSAADSAPPGYVADTIKITVPHFGTLELPSTIGTGKGSVVDVFYHPATWNQLNKNTGSISPGTGPGEILYHEMVHGYREQSGLLQYRDQVADDPDMDSIEEFFAIMASNVYRSERGFTRLRASHHGYSQVKKELRSPDNYYENYKPLVDKWFGEQKGYCLDMARTPAKFNPFREAAIALGHMKAPSVSMRLP